MKKIMMLTLANLRKTKGHTLSLLAMFFIAGLLLNAGLLVFINFGSYFEKISKELNTSDVYYIMPSGLYNDEVDQYIKNNDNVEELQKENSLWGAAEIPYNDGTRKRSFLLNDAETNRNISKWKFVGEHLPADNMSIYLPYVISVDGGYKLDDKFEMTFKDKVITFTVKGFIDDVFFSSPDVGLLGVYLPHETYETVAKTLGDNYKSTLIYANLKTNNKALETEIRELIKQENSSAFGDLTSSLFSLDLPVVKMSRTIMASAISAMMVAFAAIIVLICLIVVRFRIRNSIEEDMTKIGSLKAIGYTSPQIISSVIMQFSLIAIAGSIIGILLSYLTTPALSDVFAHQSGLMWEQDFDGVISSIALAFMILVVIIVSFLAAARIRKLNPITALRGGITTHSFRKNHMPLHKSFGSLPVVLALKSSLQNMRQSLMLSVIFIAVAFASTFSVIMYYNSAIDLRKFAETPGIELTNAIAILKPGENSEQMAQNIRSMSDVRKVLYIDETMVKLDNNDTMVYVMDDYSQKETMMAYEGRYPLHSNEVAIAGALAESLQKKVGDNVTLKFGDNEADYIITGLTQGSSMGGMFASVRTDGLLKLNPDFKQITLQIYLNKGTDAEEFVKKLDNQYGESLMRTVDFDKSFKQGMGAYAGIVSQVGIVMLVVTILVDILVLYFVINSSVIRRKRELGIQKAIGFSTIQLMNQLSLGFLPPIIIGVLIGSILGMTQTNAIMSMAQRPMGVMKANFIITPDLIALFGIAIILVSYITSMLITYRIKKISAYALVSE